MSNLNESNKGDNYCQQRTGQVWEIKREGNKLPSDEGYKDLSIV